jgi:hypothetical protein
MTDWLLFVCGLGVLVTTWIIAREKHAREDLDTRKRAAALGPSRLGRKLAERHYE